MLNIQISEYKCPYVLDSYNDKKYLATTYIGVYFGESDGFDLNAYIFSIGQFSENLFSMIYIKSLNVGDFFTLTVLSDISIIEKNKNPISEEEYDGIFHFIEMDYNNGYDRWISGLLPKLKSYKRNLKIRDILS